MLRLTFERGGSIGHRIRGVDRADPMAEIIQHHYSFYRSCSIPDATLECDLRTAFAHDLFEVKFQEQWLQTLYTAFTNKRSNI